MTYKIRVILDVEEDVFRDLVVNESIKLDELHFAIAKSFGFKGQEMASFYKTDKNWDEGEEIPLFDMSEMGNALSMSTCITSDILKEKGYKLIYVYDFFSMWTFFVELIKIFDSKEENVPIIALSFGNVPDKAPQKEFIGEDLSDDFDTFSDETDFENIDDIDLDNY